MKKVPMKKVKNEAPNEIASYFHCARCMPLRPPGTPPATWAMLAVGLTKAGEIQVWCTRCELSVFHAASRSAAPELLEALRSCQAAIYTLSDEVVGNKAANWGIVNEAGIATARAIAKAEGGK